MLHLGYQELICHCQLSHLHSTTYTRPTYTHQGIVNWHFLNSHARITRTLQSHISNAPPKISTSSNYPSTSSGKMPAPHLGQKAGHENRRFKCFVEMLNLASVCRWCGLVGIGFTWRSLCNCGTKISYIYSFSNCRPPWHCPHQLPQNHLIWGVQLTHCMSNPNRCSTGKVSAFTFTSAPDMSISIVAKG